MMSQYEQYKAREPDWRGSIQKRFRWSKLKFEWGRWCYIVSHIQGQGNFAWWEWEEDNAPH